MPAIIIVAMVRESTLSVFVFLRLRLTLVKSSDTDLILRNKVSNPSRLLEIEKDLNSTSPSEFVIK